MAEHFGVVPPDILKSLDGLDPLRRVVSGDLPMPTMARALDFALTEVENGRAVFTGTASSEHLNPMGTVHGGYAATLLDSCMGCAVHSTLKAGTGYTTLEFKVNLVRVLTEETGAVRAEGRIVHAGRRVARLKGISGTARAESWPTQPPPVCCFHFSSPPDRRGNRPPQRSRFPREGPPLNRSVQAHFIGCRVISTGAADGA